MSPQGPGLGGPTPRQYDPLRRRDGLVNPPAIVGAAKSDRTRGRWMPKSKARNLPKKRPKPELRAAGTRTSNQPARNVDYEALARFRHQLRRFLSFSETAANKAGLTPQQHQALLAIKGFSSPDPISVGDLAQYLFIRHHTAVELMDRMTKLGLLKRVVDGDDSRRVLLKLTKKGELRLQTLSKMHFEELRSASPALTRILRTFQQSRTR
jgi:DNA-binding MarR family transcriptional regulator